MSSHWSDSLIALDACKEATDWAKTQPSYEAAWTKCDRADWLLWLAGKLCTIDSPEHRAVVGAAAACARAVLPRFESRFPNDARPRNAIVAAEAFSTSTGHAAWAAWAVSRAAGAAARAAWAVGDASRAAGAAAWAAWAVGDASWAAGAAADAVATNNDCDFLAIVRRYIPTPPPLPAY